MLLYSLTGDAMKNFDEFHIDLKRIFLDMAYRRENKHAIEKNENIDINSLLNKRMSKNNMKKLLSYLIANEKDFNCKVVAFNNFFDYVIFHNTHHFYNNLPISYSKICNCIE